MILNAGVYNTFLNVRRVAVDSVYTVGEGVRGVAAVGGSAVSAAATFTSTVDPAATFKSMATAGSVAAGSAAVAAGTMLESMAAGSICPRRLESCRRRSRSQPVAARDRTKNCEVSPNEDGDEGAMLDMYQRCQMERLSLALNDPTSWRRAMVLRSEADASDGPSRLSSPGAAKDSCTGAPAEGPSAEVKSWINAAMSRVEQLVRQSGEETGPEQTSEAEMPPVVDNSPTSAADAADQDFEDRALAARVVETWVDSAAGKLERTITDEVKQTQISVLPPADSPDPHGPTVCLDLLYGEIMQQILSNYYSRPSTVAPAPDTLSHESGSLAETTTIMIRNIPNRFSQQALIEELNGLGLETRFDFVYIPIDIRTMANVGYAFVNFLQPEDAQNCLEVMQGHRFRRQGAKASRAQSACVANVQGLEANLEGYRKAVLRNSKLKRRSPVVAPGGLPPSEGKLRA